MQVLSLCVATPQENPVFSPTAKSFTFAWRCPRRYRVAAPLAQALAQGALQGVQRTART
jgi:hypothetical protein